MFEPLTDPFADYLQFSLLGNSGVQWVDALIVFILAIAAFRIFKSVILSSLHTLAKKSKTDIDDMAVAFLKKIYWPFYIYIGIYIAAQFLVIPDRVMLVLSSIFVIVVVYYAVRGVNSIIDYVGKKQVNKLAKQDKEEDTAFIKTLSTIAKAAVWILAFLMILSNLGIEITSLIAGIGVGGIAIAFALQNILEDLFSSFTIHFDKPFKKGDFIVIGDDVGTVKHIGIKTTRLDTLGGQELVVSNRELTSTRINNYKRMQKRRIVFGIGLEYGTDPKKLENVPSLIQKIIEKQEKVDFDRCHFKSFGDFSLNFETVYYMKTSDYAKYMDTQQAINLEIAKQFAKEKLEMAFPTQTVFVKK